MENSFLCPGDLLQNKENLLMYIPKYIEFETIFEEIPTELSKLNG